MLGLELRETDLTDDRLANVLTMLGAEEKQERIAQRLSRDWITMYELPTEVSRYDSTTIAVYQATDESEEGIIGYGQSKDHRPDLAQFKVMLSSLDMGLPLTSQVVNGKRADDEWIEDALKQPEQWQAVTQTDEKTGEVKTIAHVYHWSRRQECDGPKGKVTWEEQVLVHFGLDLALGSGPAPLGFD